MIIDRQAELRLRSDVDVVSARKEVRDWAAELGLTSLEMTKMVTAASELARNVVIHGGGGVMCLQIVRQADRRGIRLTFEDDGPGIPDLELAMRDGYSTGGGMGIGLPGAKRLVNDFALSSTPSGGTSVTVVRWKR